MSIEVVFVPAHLFWTHYLLFLGDLDQTEPARGWDLQHSRAGGKRCDDLLEGSQSHFVRAETTPRLGGYCFELSHILQSFPRRISSPEAVRNAGSKGCGDLSGRYLQKASDASPQATIDPSSLTPRTTILPSPIFPTSPNSNSVPLTTPNSVPPAPALGDSFSGKCHTA